MGPRKRLLTLALGSWMLAGAPSPAAPPASPVLRGRIEMPQVSGAAWMGGDRLLLAGAEGNRVVVLEGAGARLAQGGAVTPAAGEELKAALKGKVDLDDLADAAGDGRGGVYAVTSHSRDRYGDAPEGRYRLARLRLDAAGRLVEARQTDALLQAIVNGVPFLADAVRRTPAKSGLNIGGLASTPEGHLLVGLRAPTITESEPRPHGGQEDAVVLRVRNVDALFLQPPQPAQLGDVVKLDLRGQGIRGMAYDAGAKGCWLLAGLSSAPNHQVKSPWALWFWNEKDPPRLVPLPSGADLETPEAVCPFPLDGRPYLLLIEAGKQASPYVLFPTPPVGAAP